MKKIYKSLEKLLENISRSKKESFIMKSPAIYSLTSMSSEQIKKCETEKFISLKILKNKEIDNICVKMIRKMKGDDYEFYF